MDQSAKLVSLATSVPPHVLNQSDVASAASCGFAGRYDDFDRMARVFKSSGICQRHAVRPIDWYLTPLGWPERTSAYLEGACQLFVDAATRALDAAELDAAEVDTIVTISSTGVATPSLEARVAGRMGFRADVERVPVFGLGCAGGVSGFSIASRLACSRPGSIVLLVAVEVCTLAFRLDELTKANIVATALFGDGAAACVLKAYDGGAAAVEMSGQHTWPDTLDIMGWRIDPQGFGVIFDRAIPPFAQAHIAPAIAGILARSGLALEDIDRFACHPGGSKVILALERALSLEQGSLDHERAVLDGLWQHVVADRALRTGPCSSCGLAFAHIVDCNGAWFHRELRFPEESRVTAAALLLGLVTAERIAELTLSRRNTAALLAKGAIEVAPGHYPAIVLMHALWLASLWIFGATRMIDPTWLAVFLSLQVLRVWTLMTLGPRWTTRIIVLPGSALVSNGPYRLVSHPNYLVVVGEIATLPLCLGLPWIALIFSAANAILLSIRIRAETAALTGSRCVERA